MINVLTVFVLSATLIVIAGVFLTKFADAIADLTGMGRLLVGSILLAGATSLPKLSVDTNAILIGQPNLAVGDIFGSCLCNLLILAVLDVTRYSKGRMLSTMSSAHALSGMMSILLCAVAVLAILTPPPFQLPIGAGLGIGS
jgi:cation:H+ antiporter